MKKEELTKELILSVTPYGMNELVDSFIMGLNGENPELYLNWSGDVEAAWKMEEALYAKTPEMGMRYARRLIDVMNLGEDRRLSTLAKLIRATPVQRCEAALLAVIDS